MNEFEEVIAPETVEQLCGEIESRSRVLPIGARTKPPLSADADVTLISLRGLRGMIQYEPSEFTFTARAGTTVSEIDAALAQRGQYLPLDPMLGSAGATIGGTVAAGMSGPGRFRFGGVRDFLLGVEFISGDGQPIRAGGKVVKNAAGFDIPKFLVGSLGRFGAMTELTFKVFPRPAATQTLRVACQSHRQALERIAAAASSRWELDAIDYRPGESAIFLRIAGPEQACEGLAAEITSHWGEDVRPLEHAQAWWQSVNELSWNQDAAHAVKIPVTPSQFSAIEESLDADHMHLSVAGNVIWALLPDDEALAKLDDALNSLALAGLVVRGSSDQPQIGRWPKSEMQSAVKNAMDPPAKFPSLV